MKSRHFLSTLLALFFSIEALAYDAYIDGIYYNFYGDVVEVTDNTIWGSYSGSVVIPQSVTYYGKKYNVMSIGENAFTDCDRVTSVKVGFAISSNCFSNRKIAILYVPSDRKAAFQTASYWKNKTKRYARLSA